MPKYEVTIESRTTHYIDAQDRDEAIALALDGENVSYYEALSVEVAEEEEDEDNE
jgi:hypothetical protein